MNLTMDGVAGSVDRALAEPIMLVLSLLTVPGALLQIFVKLAPDVSLPLDLFDWAVISVLIVKYLSQYITAESRVRYVSDPWSLLDLTIILLAFAGAALSLPILYSAPVLRLVRVAKVVTESGQAPKKRQKLPATL